MFKKINRIYNRVNTYKQHNKKQSACSKKYETKLRAEGRAQAYETVLQHLEKVLFDNQ